MLDGLDYVLVALAAVAAGFVNAIAGGGTLVSFPVLTAIGIPAVAANVTNAVALCPGYFGATLAQRRDLAGQETRLRLLLPAAAAGGIVGGLLLLVSGDKVFRAIVPFLILLASGLLAAQEPLRAGLLRRAADRGRGSTEAAAALPVALAAIYGGYFGAGLSVIVLAVMGLLIVDTFTRLNALKQVVALTVNVAAAVFFLFSGQVVWSVAATMGVGAAAGGAIGGRFASRLNPVLLRRIVVVIGFVVAVLYFVR